MKKYIWIIITVLLFAILVVGALYIHISTNNNFKEVSVNELTKKIEDKDSFIIMITNSSLSNDNFFKNELKLISQKERIEVFYIDVKDLNTIDLTTVVNVVSFDTVPTLAFISNGIENDKTNRVVEYSEDTTEKIITILTKNGYLK